MITGTIKSQIDAIWNAFWSGGISNPMEVIEQMTYLLFIKRLDELETVQERKASRLKREVENPIFNKKQQKLRWSVFKQMGDAATMYEQVATKVFPFIKNLGTEDSTYAAHMKDARFTIPTPALLAKVVDMLDAIPMDDRDTKGDLYEYMLGKIATAGQNGQFRTPRHIIKLMVEMMAPKPSDTICDPACGTAGFLVAASEYLNRHHQQEIYADKKSAKRFNHDTFHGFDFDSTMLRVGSMNMLLHGVENPAIENRDSLSESHAGVEGQFSLILANPPFAGSLDYESTAKDLQRMVKTKKTELLFLALFLRLLKPGGRAAVIVPDGVLFGSSNAHKADSTRKWADGFVYVDLPAFNFLRKSTLFPGDIVISNVGDPGIVFRVPDLGKPMTLGPNSILVRPDDKKADKSFLAHYLQSELGQAAIEAITSSTAQRKFNKTSFRQISIPLPPLSEQRRIAAILDKADALRAKRREAIAKLDQLLQSAFLAIFGDPMTNPKGWPLKSLEALSDPNDRINYGVVQPGAEVSGGVPVVRVGDIDGGILEQSSIKRIDPEIERSYVRSRLRGNELLVSCVGSIGTVAIVPPSAIGFNIARAVTRVPLTNPKARLFIQQCLRSAALQRYFAEKTRTVSQPTLNVEFVKSAMVFDPPEAMVQPYCELVERIGSARAHQLISMAGIEACFASLQQRAFQGAL